MENPLVSIVMPVYKVERFIESAVDDVLKQTFTDFELLLVDDCSPDESGRICDALAEKDSRIRVVHFSANKGLSGVRNTAIEMVRGKYLSFLDSDDRFDINLLEKAVKSIEENPADVVIFGLVEEHYGKDGKLKNIISVCPENKTLRNIEEVRNYIIELEKSGLYGYSCNKLYNLQTLKECGARFPVMKFNEDIIFNIDFFMKVKSCNILAYTPYHYIKRFESSITSRFIPTYYEDIMLKIKRLYGQFESWGMLTDEVMEVITQRYVRYVFSALQRNCDKRSGLNSRKRRAFLREIFKSEMYEKLKAYMGGGGLSGIMAGCLKRQNVFCCLAISRIIYLVKKFMPKLFSQMS